MLTIMPNEREKDPHLRILSKDLATIPISAILANLRERDVTIYLPKFKIENNLNLMSTLQHVSSAMKKPIFHNYQHSSLLAGH